MKSYVAVIDPDSFVMDTNWYGVKPCRTCGKEARLYNVMFQKYRYWFGLHCAHAELDAKKVKA